MLRIEKNIIKNRALRLWKHESTRGICNCSDHKKAGFRYNFFLSRFQVVCTVTCDRTEEKQRQAVDGPLFGGYFTESLQTWWPLISPLNQYQATVVDTPPKNLRYFFEGGGYQITLFVAARARTIKHSRAAGSTVMKPMVERSPGKMSL